MRPILYSSKSQYWTSGSLEPIQILLSQNSHGWDRDWDCWSFLWDYDRNRNSEWVSVTTSSKIEDLSLSVNFFGQEQSQHVWYSYSHTVEFWIYQDKVEKIVQIYKSLADVGLCVFNYILM